jgi:putative membrane protein
MGDSDGGTSLLREHLANERTHLAYLRTAIALLTFGISLNRFALFLLEQGSPPTTQPPWSILDVRHIGLGMVLAGLAIIILSTLRYARVSRAIDRGVFRPSRTAVWIGSSLLLLLAAASLGWLFLGR